MERSGMTLGGGTVAHPDAPHALAPDDQTVDVTSRPSMAVAIDLAAVRRMRVFHAFGVAAPLIGVVLSLRLGGDPALRVAFWVGMGVLALSNVVMLLAVRAPSVETPATVALWILGGLGCLPAVAYFGPYSAVVLILLVAITMVAIGRPGMVAATVMVISLVSHLGMTIPLIAGWWRDRGILSSDGLDQGQRLITELLLVALMLSGYGIGRWVRSSSADALRELEKARRELGDQQQALAEIHLDVARAKRWKEGRWTGQTLGRWKLGFILGRGSMGEVYEAIASDGRQGALKLLAPRAEVTDSLLERFHREQKVVARLESPYIVRVLEISPPDAQVPYIVMERLRGFDLASELRRVSRMPLATVLTMMKQVASGLEVARLANIVHRDLKPHNLFCHDGRWKILDFGIAKVIGSEGTLTGAAIIGTPHYMAPEQVTDQSGASVTHQTDVYALGAITYRCLTGRAPFNAADVAGLLFQVVNRPAPRPSSFAEIPRAVEDVLAVAMAKDPRQRFETGLAFLEQLAAAATGPVDLTVPANAWR
jgi:hypothetical protein